MKKYLLLILIPVFLLSTSCGKKRPNMAKDQKDRGTVQDIDMIDPVTTAKNINKSSKKFAEDSQLLVSKKTNKGNRRSPVVNVSIDPQSLTPVKILDWNRPIKDLETIPVTLKFNVINIRSALKLFASTVKRNIIIGDEVKGDITLDFDGIRWGSAVYAILEMNNLVMLNDQASGMLRVHTKTKYLELEKQKVTYTNMINDNLSQLGKSESVGPSATDGNQTQAEETTTEIFKVFNQESANVVATLTSVVDGLTILDDPPNNQLIITGTSTQLDEAEQLLDKIDIATKSIMIEAFIINAGDGFTKTFDANMLAQSTIASRTQGENITEGFGATNPASPATDVTADDGITFGSASLQGGMLLLGNIGRTRLQAVISASINDTNSESISNPKLFALDGEPASLVQGLSFVKVIPASGDTASTTTTINLSLNLTVTPQVLGEKIKLQLAIANNSLGEGGGAADTPINTETVNSTVVINDGDVAVLGGVYTNTRKDSENYVPILGKIPVVGNLFNKKTKEDTKSQLLIFITANIV
jgi:type IV pilus assembly protein PilQ